MYDADLKEGLLQPVPAVCCFLIQQLIIKNLQITTANFSQNRQGIQHYEDKNAMFDKVQAILAKQLRKDPALITPESNIKKDLGADSIDILQLLMRIEDQYGLVIPDESLATFITVGDVVRYLEGLEK